MTVDPEVLASAEGGRHLEGGGERLHTARARILVVDDNRDAAEMLVEMLQASGYETELAHDGPQALRVAPEFKPTIALLDIGLPVMDGYELARRMQGDPALAEVRLVAITGYGQEEARRRSQEAGFAAHLVRPVLFDALRSVLREIEGGSG
jgi:CheY-like chemotaxis protein